LLQAGRCISDVYLMSQLSVVQQISYPFSVLHRCYMLFSLFTCRVWSVHSVWRPFSCGLLEKTSTPFPWTQQFKCSMASADPASGGGAATVAKAISRWAGRSDLPRPWSVRYEILGASDRDAYRRWRDNSWSSRSSTRNGDSRDRLMWCQTNMGGQLDCLTKVISAKLLCRAWKHLHLHFFLKNIH
jgi:hypothetical protein